MGPASGGPVSSAGAPEGGESCRAGFFFCTRASKGNMSAKAAIEIL